MESAQLDETSADISNEDGSIMFRANGSQVHFQGFLFIEIEKKIKYYQIL